jgi:Tol biopolymer transport system component
MKCTAFLGFMAAALAAIVAAPAAVPASAPGRIAFTLKFSKGQLYSVRPDGSHRQRLTTGLEESYQPVPSPDGRHILFARGNSNDEIDIYVVDRDG